MDEPGLDRDRHERALAALRRVNGVSFAAGRVCREVRALSSTLGRSVRVLDVACGGGDVLGRVGRWAKATGTPVELHGCDLSPVALATAARAAPPGVRLELFELDALAGDFPAGYDLVTSSLFLHHLERSAAVGFLKRAAASASVLLVQDLRRTRLGYALAWIGLHALTTSDVARHDGLISVRAAFREDEVLTMCAEAGIPDATVARVWPQRFVLRCARA